MENIAAEVDPNTRSVAVRVVVNNPGEFLKRQMYVQVHIRDSQAKTGLLVPVSAVLRDEENLPFVYVDPAGWKLRPPACDAWAIAAATDTTSSAAFDPGERIVADGAIFVQFMQNQ